MFQILLLFSRRIEIWSFFLQVLFNFKIECVSVCEPAISHFSVVYHLVNIDFPLAYRLPRNVQEGGKLIAEI